MPDRSHLDVDLRPALDELGRAYREALAWRDWRASDRQLVLLRARLGTILTLLGWQPDDTAVRMPPGPGGST